MKAPAGAGIGIRGSKKSSQKARDLLRAVALDCDARGLSADSDRLDGRHNSERDKQQRYTRGGCDSDPMPPDELSSA